MLNNLKNLQYRFFPRKYLKKIIKLIVYIDGHDLNFLLSGVLQKCCIFNFTLRLFLLIFISLVSSPSHRKTQ